MIKLYLDDLRPIPEGFIGIRDYTEFINFIKTNPLPQFISFDHDLGEGKTGFDCAKFLVEFCIDNHLNLPDFFVHSHNPIGKENINSLLTNFNKHRNL